MSRWFREPPVVGTNQFYLCNQCKERVPVRNNRVAEAPAVAQEYWYDSFRTDNGKRSIQLLERSVLQGCQSCGHLLRAAQLVETHPKGIHILVDGQKKLLKIYDDDNAVFDWAHYVDVYERKTDLLPPLRQSLDIPRRADSLATWSFLEKCLAACINEHHSECRRTQPARNPTRLLYMDWNTETGRIIEMKGQSHKSYIALSHCWGNTPHKVLTRASFEEDCRSIQFQALPNTFKDALVVAHRFNISYIWIDSLCIIQDDPVDWAREASSMVSVYEHAIFTIVAASSPSSSYSFLRRERMPARLLGMRMSQSNSQMKVLARRHIWKGIHMPGTESLPHAYKQNDRDDRPGTSHPSRLPDRDPIDNRAWTLQERVMSRRSIIFSDEEVQWECREAQMCQCSGTATTLNRIWDSSVALYELFGYEQDTRETNLWYSRWITKFQYHPWHAYICWCTIVGEYTKRSLTRESDKLPAISAIASTFSQMLDSAYFAGLWTCYLDKELMWVVRDTQKTALPPPTGYRAPTFSWTSVDGAISMYTLNHELLFQASNCQVSLKTDHAFGEITSASVLLKGPLAEGRLEKLHIEEEQRWTYNITVGNCVFGTVKRGFTKSWTEGGTCTFRFWEDCNLAAFDYQPPTSTEVERTVRRSSRSDQVAWAPRKVSLLMLFSTYDTYSTYWRLLVLGPSGNYPGCFERLGMMEYARHPPRANTDSSGDDIIHQYVDEEFREASIKVV